MSKINPAVLLAAKQLISAPTGWIKGNYAEDHSGRAILPDRPLACKFCTMGAIANALEVTPGQGSTNDIWLPYEVFMDECFVDWDQPKGHRSQDVTEFNDDDLTTHSDVMDFMSFCIARALEQEKPR